MTGAQQWSPRLALIDTTPVPDAWVPIVAALARLAMSNPDVLREDEAFDWHAATDDLNALQAYVAHRAAVLRHRNDGDGSARRTVRPSEPQ